MTLDSAMKKVESKKLKVTTTIDRVSAANAVHPLVRLVLFLFELRGPAWAVGSYSIGPPAR